MGPSSHDPKITVAPAWPVLKSGSEGQESVPEFCLDLLGAGTAVGLPLTGEGHRNRGCDARDGGGRDIETVALEHADLVGQGEDLPRQREQFFVLRHLERVLPVTLFDELPLGIGEHLAALVGAVLADQEERREEDCLERDDHGQ